MKLRAIILSSFAIFACESFADIVFTKQGDMLAAAIEHGAVSGTMAGDVADHFSRQFKTDSPLLVTAKVIKSYKREGCKRIAVQYTKKDVSTPKGMTDAILKMEVNYCFDGTPPIGLE